MYDPFRLQVLTVSLDSQVVLAVLGVLVAGLVARDRARGLGWGPGGVWDASLSVATWGIVAGRLGWVATHLEYYLRAPLQVAALGDGGFLFGTAVLGAGWALWREGRALDLPAEELGRIVAPAAAAAFLLDRAGCALTACGSGQAASVPWALVRSGVSLHPVGLYGVALWLGAWLALWRWGRTAPAAVSWLALLAALALDRAVAWWFGYAGADGLAASLALLSASPVLFTRARQRGPRGRVPQAGPLA